MAPLMTLTNPRYSNPIHQADPELIRHRSQRRQVLRRGVIAAVSLTLAALAVGVSYFVGTHLLAAWWLERLNGAVSWDIGPTNWRQGGVTSVAFNWRNSQLGNELSNGDLNHLRKLHRVVSLNLAEADKITSKGLAALRGLDFLSVLNLDRLTRYRHPGFSIQSPPLTDSCLVHLQSLPRLDCLSLSGNLITDQGLAQIATMANLKTLDLSATEVTDAGLVHLMGMNGLETINLGATRVTKEGIAQLRAARPDLSIEFDIEPSIEAGIKLHREATQ